MIALLGGYLSGLVPWRIVAEVCIAALALVAAFAAGHSGGVKADHAVMQAELDAIVQADQAKLIAAQQAAADETKRRLDAARSQDHEDLTHAEHRADVAVAAAGAVDRLRQRAEATAKLADAACRSASAAGVSAPASSPGLVLADLSGSLAEEARRNAAFADKAWDASASCEARYDGLSHQR